MFYRMVFDSRGYSPEVAEILAQGEDGKRPMPLVTRQPAGEAIVSQLRRLAASAVFPEARSPKGALAGLWLYFSCADEAHRIAQDVETPEGSFWHGIVHRQEPDAMNAAYWFRRVGHHPLFPLLNSEAINAGWLSTGGVWDPFAFINFCEQCRSRPGSREEQLALQIQLIEWQLLFDYCARPVR